MSEEMDDIQSWWEIPSIVHFCDVFSPLLSKHLCPVNINEFERAVEDNSHLLTDMAMRFMKMYVRYSLNTLLNTNKWWNKMKKLFAKNCIIYNFGNPLDSVTCFDELTRKQKVVTLYILCNLILDNKCFKSSISQQPKLWPSFNVKPLGFGLNKSVYWYFGTTKLYKEDFENTTDISTNSSKLNDLNCESCPSELFGSGKWSIVCDDNASWNLFVSNIENSNDVNIKHLHKSVCDIINNLPTLKRKRTFYEYLKPVSRLPPRTTRGLRVAYVEYDSNTSDSDSDSSINSCSTQPLPRNTHKRSLRSTYANDEYDSNTSDSDSDFIINSSSTQPLPRNTHKKSLRSTYVNAESDATIKSSDNSKHAQVNKTVHGDLFASLSTAEINKNPGLFHNIKVNDTENKKMDNEKNKTTIKSLLNSINTVKNSINRSDLIKIRQECLEKEVRVNIIPHDCIIDQNQESPQYSGSNKKKKNHNIKVNENENKKMHKEDNKTTIKSLSNGINTVENSVNRSDLLQIRQACLEKEVRVNIMPHDCIIDQNQENPQYSGSIKKKIQTSTQFQNKTKQSPFKDLNY